MKRYKLLLLCAAMGVLTACGAQTSGAQKPGSAVTAASETDGAVTLYLVRHGKTYLNSTDQVQGWIDSPLTEQGERQADAVGRGMKDIRFVTAFSSDLGRQRDTARHILAQNEGTIPELREVKGLREWFYGGFEGKRNDEMWAPIFEDYGLEFDDEWSQYDKLMEQMSDEDIANAIVANDESGQAETYDAITKRTREAMEEIVQTTLEAGGGNALVVSSGSEIPTILALLVPGQYEDDDIDNCSVTVLTYRDGAYTLERCGDTGYRDAGMTQEDRAAEAAAKAEEDEAEEAAAETAKAEEPEDQAAAGLTAGTDDGPTAGGVRESAAVFSGISADVLIPSARGTDIHATVTVPETVGKDGCALVLFAHGFMGSRDESGEFTAVAEGLAERGIASVRIDFPGCNESTESFLDYNFKNMSDDLDAALAYARKQMKVDESRKGILGYSMGGRMAALYLGEEQFDTAVLWAPAASNGFDAASAMGSEAEMERRLEDARKNGKGVIHIWDEEIEVGTEYLEELKTGRPLDPLGAYTGNLLVVTGGVDDTVVKPITDRVLEAAVNTNITVHLDVPRAGHDLGGYEDDEAVRAAVVDATVDFFGSHMSPD